MLCNVCATFGAREWNVSMTGQQQITGGNTSQPLSCCRLHSICLTALTCCAALLLTAVNMQPAEKVLSARVVVSSKHKRDAKAAG